MPSVIDLFSGAGGLSFGLKKAGWAVEAAIEVDHTASLTHAQNFPECEHITSDVRQVNFEKFSGIDLIAGGPPCQPFSVSGKRLGAFDVRDMVPEFVRAVKQVRPRAFLMENVAGLAGSRFSDYLSSQIFSLHSLGYTVFCKVLCAADFGVAQKRNRLFLVGIRSDLKNSKPFSFPQPTHGPDKEKMHLSVADALIDVPDDVPNKAKVVFCKNPILRKSPFAGMMFNGKGRPLNHYGLGHTIPASAGGNRTHILDPFGIITQYHSELMAGKQPRSGELKDVRRLTVRESARIQSFPDHFEFLGRQSARYSQVGNAVPPDLAACVAREVTAAIL